MMMDHAVNVSGVPPEWRDGVKQVVLESLRQVGVDYPFTTFNWSTDETEVVNSADGTPATEGSTMSIALPPLSEILANWQPLLTDISAACQGILVTIPMQGVVQVALNGAIL